MVSRSGEGLREGGREGVRGDRKREGSLPSDDFPCGSVVTMVLGPDPERRRTPSHSHRDRSRLKREPDSVPLGDFSPILPVGPSLSSSPTKTGS